MLVLLKMYMATDLITTRVCPYTQIPCDGQYAGQGKVCGLKNVDGSKYIQVIRNHPLGWRPHFMSRFHTKFHVNLASSWIKVLTGGQTNKYRLTD